MASLRAIGQKKLLMAKCRVSDGKSSDLSWIRFSCIIESQAYQDTSSSPMEHFLAEISALTETTQPTLMFFLWELLGIMILFGGLNHGPYPPKN